MNAIINYLKLCSIVAAIGPAVVMANDTPATYESEIFNDIKQIEEQSKETYEALGNVGAELPSDFDEKVKRLIALAASGMSSPKDAAAYHYLESEIVATLHTKLSQVMNTRSETKSEIKDLRTSIEESKGKAITQQSLAKNDLDEALSSKDNLLKYLKEAVRHAKKIKDSGRNVPAEYNRLLIELKDDYAISLETVDNKSRVVANHEALISQYNRYSNKLEQDENLFTAYYDRVELDKRFLEAHAEAAIPLIITHRLEYSMSKNVQLPNLDFKDLKTALSQNSESSAPIPGGDASGDAAQDSIDKAEADRVKADFIIEEFSTVTEE